MAIDMVNIRLPGGLYTDDVLHRIARFRSLTGEVEMAIVDACNARMLFPMFVTQVLSVAVASVGTEAFSPEVCRALCIADRQVLLLELSKALCGDSYWLQPTCSACSNKFDLAINRSEIPVAEAPGSYPFFEGKLGSQVVKLRALNGEVEERIARLSDDSESIRVLVELAVVSDNRISIADLSDENIKELELQLEDGAPAVTDELISACPYCEKEVRLELDFSVGLLAACSILKDVHQIAQHYHWSEESILKLSRVRRKQYLNMIDRARGVEA